MSLNSLHASDEGSFAFVKRAAHKTAKRNRTMTRNRNLMSTVAAILAIAAILSLGGVTALLAGSNDGARSATPRSPTDRTGPGPLPTRRLGTRFRFNRRSGLRPMPHLTRMVPTRRTASRSPVLVFLGISRAAHRAVGKGVLPDSRDQQKGIWESGFHLSFVARISV
jgi:hypothetical protein